MKKTALLLLSVFIFFALTVPAQNFSRLEQLADQLKDRTEDLIKLTSKSLKKRSTNSREDLEQAFLAEQLLSSAKLMEELIDDKRSPDELRDSGQILTGLIRRSERFNSNPTEWQSASQTIRDLNRELSFYSGPDNNKPAGDDDQRTIVGRVFWRGKADAEVNLVIRDLSLEVRTISGQTFPPGTHSFTSRLRPDDSLTVGVKKTEGRGDVRVLQQPEAANNYTTIIQILDPDRAAGEYSLEIFWYRQTN